MDGEGTGYFQFSGLTIAYFSTLSYQLSLSPLKETCCRSSIPSIQYSLSPPRSAHCLSPWCIQEPGREEQYLESEWIGLGLGSEV